MEKIIEETHTLFVSITKEQYDALRAIADREKKSLAEVAIEAIDVYIQKKSQEGRDKIVEKNVREMMKELEKKKWRI